jgi:hypothetical protein
MAGVIMGANIAGIYGAQIFRADDKPKYRRGFSIACAVLAVGLLLAIFRFIDEKLLRRKTKGAISERSSSDAENFDEKVAAPPSGDLPPPIVLDNRRASVTNAI